MTQPREEQDHKRTALLILFLSRILALARQLPLQLIAVTATGVIHGALSAPRGIWIRRRRIVRVPIPVSFLIRVLAVYHCELLSDSAFA